ncbi:glucose dehydrogenase [FAD, quinone]-like [Hetaerina americana]|uniref:glucose dehydrogenase [FAD, quinone]-like n=1 Tax=Hetaerina americana TaxID=62018 RepID=UPI003A7F30D9
MITSTCGNCSFVDTSYLANTCGPGFAVFMGMLEVLLMSRCDLNQACSRLGQNDLSYLDDEYDFIVVGAGVAGPVVASRLSEPRDNGGKPWTVLLMEAGPEEPTISSIPSFCFAARNTSLDWNFYSDEKTACYSTGNKCWWPRGKMVGGTGAMTGMMYTRGSSVTYDDWANAGNTGWSFEEVLPYFKKSEHLVDPSIGDEGYHGFDGPMLVQRFPYRPPFADDLIKAGAEMGFNSGDFSGRNLSNFGIAPVMVDSTSLRASTPRAFLRPHVNDRPNLRLETEVHVTRVLIDESLGRATGVGYLRGGKEHIVRARKEVILSAGTIGTAQILMNSGIGPKEDLEYIGQQVVYDVPGVGQNLHNHVSAPVTFTIDDDDYQTLTNDSIQEFLDSRTGPMASTSLTQMTAFLQSKNSREGVPDIQNLLIVLRQVFFDGFDANCSATGDAKECVNGQPGPCPDHRRRIVARPTLVSPYSRGHLMIKDTSPMTTPYMSAGYFTDERDVDALVDGMMQIAERLPATEAMKKWGMVLDNTPSPGCGDETFGTAGYWKCTVLQDTGPENHQSGTAKMGPAEDKYAVVDPQLRVHALPNLRVADASVFPQVPNGNPIPAVMMVAERCADFIKQTYPD